MSRYETLLYAAVLMMALAWTIGITSAHGMRPVPQCNEDVVIVGAGSFEDGRWSGYVCGAAVDDH